MSADTYRRHFQPDEESPEAVMHDVSALLVTARSHRREAVAYIKELRHGVHNSTELATKEKSVIAHLLYVADELAVNLEQVWSRIIGAFPGVTNPETSQAIVDAEDDLKKMMVRLQEFKVAAPLSEFSGERNLFFDSVDELMYNLEASIRALTNEIKYVFEPFTRSSAESVTHVENLVTAANKAFQASRLLSQTANLFFKRYYTTH